MRKLGFVVISLSLGMLVFAGCGGDDGVSLPDARPMIDAPNMSNCNFEANYATLGFGQPIALMGSRNTMTQALQFGIVGIVSQMPMDPNNAGFLLFFQEGSGGFTGGFASGTVDPVDSGANCGACVEGWGGFTLNGNQIDTNTIQEFLIPNAGSMTLTTFTNLPPVAGQVSNVVGTFDNVAFDGFDSLGNANGCTSAVGTFSFEFNVTWPQ